MCSIIVKFNIISSNVQKFKYLKGRVTWTKLSPKNASICCLSLEAETEQTGVVNVEKDTDHMGSECFNSAVNPEIVNALKPFICFIKMNGLKYTN